MSAEAITDIIDPEDILKLYEKDRWCGALPQLSLNAVRSIGSYLVDTGMANIAGYVSVGGPWGREHGATLRTLMIPVIAALPDDTWLAGPYLLQGKYYRHGIGIWAPQACVDVVPPNELIGQVL